MSGNLSSLSIGGGAVKSIQRGVTVPGATATVTSVNTSKARLRMCGFSGGALGAAADVVLTNSTTITTTGNAARVSWELEEVY